MQALFQLSYSPAARKSSTGGGWGGGTSVGSRGAAGGRAWRMAPAG